MLYQHMPQVALWCNTLAKGKEQWSNFAITCKSSTPPCRSCTYMNCLSHGVHYQLMVSKPYHREGGCKELIPQDPEYDS